MIINIRSITGKEEFEKVKPRLVEILFSAYEKYPEYGVEDESEAVRYLDWLYKADPEGFFLAIWEGDIVAGFVATHSQWWDKYIGKFVGEIHEISIDSSYHGKGIGSMLMKTAEEYFLRDGRDIAALWVGVNNTAAIRFYERKGYIRGEIRGPWLRMRKYIGG